jgi:myosin heavy subunit
MEESQEANADDMLQVRMRLQEVRKELDEKEISIDRLNQNLKVVEDERDRYQIFIGQVEEEQRGERQISEQRIAELKKSVTDITKIADDRSKKIKDFKNLLVHKEKELFGLVKRVEELVEENKKLLDRIVEREQEIGRLNTRYAEASTELQSTQGDLAKTEQLNKVLDSHNKQLVTHRNQIENFFKTSMTEFLKVFDVEREHDRRHDITKDIFTGNVSRHMQPEPSLPTNSPFRASRNGSLENVRLGRGNDRRTLFSSELGLDSGIGGSETVQPQTDAPAGSDAFLEAIDEEDDQNIG